MSCDTTSTLVLGSPIEPMIVWVKPGEAWGDSLVLVEVDPVTLAETVIAWPAAPVLVFGNALLTVTGVLGPDPDTSTADALASWSMTAEQTAELTDYLPVAMLVDGATWTGGKVSV